MHGMIERRSASVAGWAVRLSSFALVLFVVAGLGHRLGLVETVAFLWLLGLIGGCAMLGLCLAAAGLQRLWVFGERAGRQSMLAAAIAALVLTPYGVSLWRFATLPALNDISTDAIDPPALDLSARKGPFVNGIGDFPAASADRIAAYYPTVTGRRYEAPLERVVEPVLRLTAARGWAISDAPDALAGSEIVVDALATSPLLGFPSDVAIRITDESASTYVDMRSASHYGRHDFGENARRIASFLKELDAVIAAEAGGIAAGQTAGE